MSSFTGDLSLFTEGKRFKSSLSVIAPLHLTLSRRRPFHIETSPLICSANQCTGFYMITVSVLKELRV